MPFCAEKVCDMRTLLKYAKNTAICELDAAIAYSHKTDMPIQSDIIQMMYVSEWTLNYDEPEIENVARWHVAVYHYNDRRSIVTR